MRPAIQLIFEIQIVIKIECKPAILYISRDVGVAHVFI